MATKIKPAGRLAIVIVLAAGVFIGARKMLSAPKKVGESHTVGRVAVPDVEESSLQGGSAVKIAFPSKAISGVGLKIVWNEMAWNAQSSINYANGGPNTTKGSLVEKAGLNIQLVRQDNCTQSCTDMIKYIQQYKNGSTKDGFFLTFMGSGIPAYIHGITEGVKALGPEYVPIVVFGSGKSYGEDKVIGAEHFKTNPQSMRGAVCHGVRMDGDLDLILKFAGDNNVPINANEKLYYPDALNLSYTGTDFLSAVNEYNQNVQQTRKLVVNGKTGKDTTVGIDMVATWTPGDVNAMNGRGGVTIISTKTYSSVMPCITITCKKFANDNRSSMENLIAALVQAGDQIRSYDDVKKFAAGLNANIWNEQTADYWYKYYNGVKVDNNTSLGGSMVYNLADMAKMFGLNGTPDIYKEIYNTFGKLQSSLYPADLPEFTEYSKAVDKSFMMSVVSNHPELLEGKPLEVDYSGDITTTVSSKDVHINFETGSANISQSSVNTLNDVYSSITTSEGLKVAIYGFTDNVGDEGNNRVLSESRAQSVRNWLIKKGVSTDRIKDVKGFGEDEPVADNTTESGRAQNRRVQIKLGE